MEHNPYPKTTSRIGGGGISYVISKVEDDFVTEMTVYYVFVLYIVCIYCSVYR